MLEYANELLKKIVGWYPFEEGKKRIYIDNSNIGSVENADEKYNYIILIRVIEEANHPETLITELKNKLTEDGRILIVLNNRLGIKYLCGEQDPYLNEVSTCLDDYVYCSQEELKGRMFDQYQIRGFLDCAGFKAVKFFSILRDLNDLNEICSHDYMPSDILNYLSTPTYKSPETIFVDERKLTEAFVNNGLIHYMSNAYLIECSMNGEHSEINQITISHEKSTKMISYTILYKSGRVETKSMYIGNDNVLTPRIPANSICCNRKIMNEGAQRYITKHVDIFSDTHGKRLLVFGSGKYAKEFIKLYAKDFPILALIDNCEDAIGTEVEGYQVKTPSYLLTLPPDTYKVIICIEVYLEVSKQLEDMGVYCYSIFSPQKYYQTRPRTTIQINTPVTNDTNKKYSIGYVAGAFDLFHIGHLNLLRRAKEQCDYLIAGVMSDERMYDLKQKMPVIPCHERMEVVAGCRFVDQVEELTVDRAGILDAYHLFHFDCMFSGDDHSEHRGWLEARDYLREQGSDIVFVPYTRETSSSKIRNQIN